MAAVAGGGEGGREEGGGGYDCEPLFSRSVLLLLMRRSVSELVAASASPCGAARPRGRDGASQAQSKHLEKRIGHNIGQRYGSG